MDNLFDERAASGGNAINIVKDWAWLKIEDIINREGEYHGWTEVEEVLRDLRSQTLKEAAKIVDDFAANGNVDLVEIAAAIRYAKGGPNG